MQYGEEIDFSCQKCGSFNKRRVNEFYAKPSKIAFFVAALIFLICTPIFLYLSLFYRVQLSNPTILLSFGGEILLPIVVYTLLLKQDRNRVNAFNRHFLR